MIGAHWLKSWSMSQSLIALSSAESELHAYIKATIEGLGVKSMAKDLGSNVDVRAIADVSAALGIIARRHVGNVRHLNTSHLWIQEVSVNKRAVLEKVAGTNNPADLMTKELGHADIVKRRVHERMFPARTSRRQFVRFVVALFRSFPYDIW